MSAADDTIDQKKREAVAELNAYREQRRREREARDAANQTAEAEIEAAILARRDEEERRAKVNADLQKFYAKREADIAAMMAAEREKRLAGDPRLQIAEHPAKRVAIMLRQALGDQFEPIFAEMRGVNYKQLVIELARIPADERAAELAREREALAARLADEARTLPAPEDDAERAILERYGFITPTRAAELDAGAL